MKYIHIIDRPCGYGKTSQMIQSFSANEKYLVVVPFLDEIQRVINEAGSEFGFTEPKVDAYSPTKLDSLTSLLLCGSNIVTSHALYEYLSEVASSGLLDDYNIIIDEVPDVASVSESVAKKSLNDIYIGGGYIETDEAGRVWPTPKWKADVSELSDTLKTRLFKQASSGCLYLTESSHFIRVLPKKLLCCGSTTTIYTYKSEGSVLCKYLDREGLPYKVDRCLKIEAGFVQQARQLITLAQVSPAMAKLQFSHRKQLRGVSSEAYRSTVQTSLKNLRGRELKEVDVRKILLTCAKDAWESRNAKKSFKPNSRLSKAQWCSNKTRGTNRFSDCTHAVYLYDQHLNPVLGRWLGVEDPAAFNDQFALTELIQWLYRTQVRKGLPVTLYMPSLRMRGILQDWLDSAAAKIAEKFEPSSNVA